MRRNVVRLALALVATSFLAACGDLATAPEAPRARRLNSLVDSVTTTVDVAPTATDTTKNARATSSQGSQI